MSKYSSADTLTMTPKEYRSLCRNGEWTGPTVNVCRGYAMTDLVILPKEYAYDFLVFCQRNPQLTTVNDVTEVGSPHPPLLAPDADLRTDLPRYQVYKDGEIIDEPTDIKKYWRDDLVCFLTGEGGSLVWALNDANLHFQNLGIFTTNIPCIPAGPFLGYMDVFCKLFEGSYYAVRAVQIASRYIFVHGPPIHIGDPSAIGIKDLSQPDLTVPHEQAAPRQLTDGGVPMFWPGFNTIRGICVEARLPIMICNSLKCCFLTDKLAEELAIL